MTIARRILLVTAAAVALVAYVVTAAVHAAPDVRARKARRRAERLAAARRGSP